MKVWDYLDIEMKSYGEVCFYYGVDSYEMVVYFIKYGERLLRVLLKYLVVY